MKTIPYEKFKHGQRVICDIKGSLIEDARINIDDDGTVYICQNKNNGAVAFYKFGYMYTWRVAYKNQSHIDGNNSVKNLKFLDRTLDDLEEGDVVVDSDGVEKTIVGICGQIVFLSNRKEMVSYWLLSDMNSRFTLKQEEEEEEKESVDSAYFYITQDKNKITYDGKTYILSK